MHRTLSALLALAAAAVAGDALAQAQPEACRAAAPSEPRAAAAHIALCGLAEPIAATLWHCGGSPRETVAAVFYDTDPGSVRLEYGDTVEVGLQMMAASGARYETPSGLVFWTKGTSAMLTRPGAAETECIVR